jgi:hypothetical protein
MKLPIYETLAIVRDHSSPTIAWEDILSLCRVASPTKPWATLPNLDLERDISAATAWLTSQLARFPNAVGIYLGLDTLNMGEGDGKNIEFGCTSDCDACTDSVDWLYNDQLKYGDDHLIYGLYELQRIYETESWKDAYSLCDYIFFLGYSGIVFAQAFARLSTLGTLLPVWGFHDGDMFVMGRKQNGEFTRLCK